MKQVLLPTVISFLILGASTAFGQGGTLCVFADPAGTQCTLHDDASGILSVYVIHIPPSSGVHGSTFAAPKPECMTGANWLTDSSPFSIVFGNSQIGCDVAYSSCVTEPTHVLTVQYVASGLSETDCPYCIVPATGYGSIQVASCDLQPMEGNGGITYVNSMLPCECSEPSGPPDLFVHPSSLYFEATETRLGLWVENRGGGTLEWVISSDQPWLSVSPSEGVNDLLTYVSVDRSGLPVGTATGNLTVSGGGENAIVPVTAVVAEPTPQLSVSPDQLLFNTTSVPKTFQITNIGTGTLTWEVSADRPWISVNPLLGTGDASVSVQVTPPGPPGIEDGQVTVESNGGSASVVVHYAPVLGEEGVIGVFADPEAMDCNLLDHAPGVLSVYIVHVLTVGAGGIEFSAPMPDCMTGAEYLGETTSFFHIGNTQTGVVVGYGACLAGTIPAIKVRYLVEGMSQSCCRFEVLPHPRNPNGRIEASSCDFRVILPASAHAIVNPNATCACRSVPVQETTWGQIKAMYAPE